MSEPSAPSSAPLAIDRSDRPGRVGLLLLFAGLLVGAAVALSFIASDQAQPFIVGLLALLAVAGVFSLFAFSIGLVQFSGPGARNDLTKLVCDTDGEGLIAVDEAGRVIYANEAYLTLTAAASWPISSRWTVSSPARRMSRTRFIVSRRRCGTSAASPRRSG